MPLMAEVVCRLAGVVKDYPGQRALDLDLLELTEGEVHALVGQNGAGKSTLVKVLAGAEQPSAGRIEIGGRAVELTSPAVAHRLGIAPVFQEMAVVPGASGYENANLGLPHPRWGPFVRWSALRRRTEAAASALGLSVRELRRTARSMSVAELQMVAICRGLLQDARLLLLDEPTASLTEHEVARLYAAIRDLARRGVAILYISHRLDEIGEIAQRVTVLRDGRRIATLPASAPRSQIVQLITGGIDEPASVTAPHHPGAMLLESRGLSVRAGTAPLDISLRSGEILGLAGLVGSGRTAIARTLAGLGRPVRVRLGGSELALRSPRAAVRAGIVFVPEDRRREGLLIGQSLAFNVTLASLHRLRLMWLFVNRRQERRVTADYVRRLSIRSRTVEQPVWQLSGGNQQKAVLARWMLRNPKVFIVDEPTVGLDVAARAEVHGILRDLANTGGGVIFVSSDLDELAAVADRALVVSRGTFVAELPKEHLTKAEILRHCYAVPEAA